MKRAAIPYASAILLATSFHMPLIAQNVPTDVIQPNSGPQPVLREEKGKGAAAGTASTPSQAQGISPAAMQQIATFEEKLKKAQKYGDNKVEADCTYQLAKLYFEAGDLSQAETLMRKSLDIELTKLSRQREAILTTIALAEILVTQKRYDEALKIYEQALSRAQTAGRNDDIIAIFNHMGALAMVSKNYDEAKALLDKAYNQAVELKSDHAQAYALINLAALTAGVKHDNKAALEYLEKSIAAGTKAEESRALGLAALEIGRIKANTNDYDGAIASYEKACKYFEEDADFPSIGKAQTAMGRLYLARHNAEKAKEYLRKSHETLKNEGAKNELVDCLIALGAAEADSGNFDNAQKFHEDAFTIAKENRYTAGQYTALSEQGFDFLLQGATEKALQKFLEANKVMETAKGVKESDRAEVFRDLGMCYSAVGQADAALKYYQDAADAYEKSGDMANKAMAYNSMAVVYLTTKGHSDFETQFNKAKELAGYVTDKSAEAALDYNYAQYKYTQHKYTEAIPLYESAVSKAKQAEDIRTQSMALRGLGLCFHDLNSQEKAREAFEQAALLADKIGTLEAQWDCALGLGKVYKALGDTKKAEEYLLKAVALVEKERGQYSRDSFKTFNMDQRQECFRDLVDLLVADKRYDVALEVAEKGKARAFLDLLEGRMRRKPGESVAAVITPDDQFKKKTEDDRILVAMATPGTSGFRSVQVVPKASTLVESSAVSPINAAPPSLAEIKELVKKSGSYFVEYSVMPDKVYLWVVSPTGEVSMPPPIKISIVDLEKKIREATASITATSKSMKELGEIEQKRQTLLKDLYALLISPAVPFLPKGAEDIVTIVPYGPLFRVPFAALIGPDNKFLVESHTISFVPAIGVLRATQKLETQQEKGNTLLAFGNPITKSISFLGTLPYSEREVKKVAELFGKDKATIEIGEKATKEALRQLAPNNTIIHLATHGLINEERPMDSALVLAPQGDDDGLLTVRDIFMMPALKARLVVLSACQTGRGKVTGDGVVGLSRAFIIAGTPSVVVSQWNVDDVMTEYQMDKFYRSFLSGTPKAKALRDAQLQTIAFMEKTQTTSTIPGTTAKAPAARPNPRYWAAFQLIGEHE